MKLLEMVKHNKQLIKNRNIDIATVQNQRLGRRIANPTNLEIIVTMPGSEWDGMYAYTTNTLVRCGDIYKELVWIPTGKSIGIGVELGVDEWEYVKIAHKEVAQC